MHTSLVAFSALYSAPLRLCGESKADSHALPRRVPDAHAHWKLNPPSWPVTSTTSPIKYSPGAFLASIVFDESSSVSTPPAVTSAFSYPSLPAGFTRHRCNPSEMASISRSPSAASGFDGAWILGQ